MTNTAARAAIDLSGYVVTDSFFGRPYIDADEDNAVPTPHRYIHGGFEGTHTRFAFCYPPADRYEGRLLQPLEGANAGHENVNTGPLGLVTGGLDMAFRLGGYTVESNMGHIGDVMDPKAGPDPTIYGWRAAAESARFSKHVATQIYGAPPSHAYVFGGSGGARRSPLCLAYAPDVWDGALPYMGDSMDGDYGDFNRLRTGTPNFPSMFNVQRVLGPKIWDVVDAMWPGGSGDPFTGLDTHQREELANLYRLGYPRGDEFMIAQPMGQIWLWTSMAERLQAEDEYFANFWTQPGHVGFDQPQCVVPDLIDAKVKVTRVLYAKELAEEAQYQAPEFAGLRALAVIFAGMNNMWDIPMALELEDIPGGYRMGAGLKVLDGEAAGRQLYCMVAAGSAKSGAGETPTVWLCDGEGEASNKRFTGVKVGDTIHVDNHGFLAFCYYYRHHLMSYTEFDFLRLDGVPIYPQYEQPEASPFMSVVHTGRFDGKLLWVHHTHDASLWPPQGLGMRKNVERERGADAGKYFRLRWTENAEHVPPMMAASPPNRHNSTWLVNYQPIIEQCLADLIDWVERDIAPDNTTFSYADGKVTLPTSAAERGGIQPVVSVTANGASRTEVKVGEQVSLHAHAEVPPGSGTLIALRWDFDGSGSFPEAAAIDGTKAAESITTTHSFDAPGTYFVTAMAESHRHGDVQATSRRISNVASARVVVS